MDEDGEVADGGECSSCATPAAPAESAQLSFFGSNLQKVGNEVLARVIDTALLTLCWLLGLVFVVACGSVIYNIR
jgi:hypothetical protein